MANTTLNSAINNLKPVKSTVGNQVPTVNSVQVKVIQFTVPTGISGSGYYTGDTLIISKFFEAGTRLLGFYWKTSVSQGATLTLAPNIGGGTAFVSATNLTSTTLVEPTLVTTSALTTTDADLNIVLAGTTVGTTAATITMSFLLAHVDAQATVTTYTI